MYSKSLAPRPLPRGGDLAVRRPFHERRGEALHRRVVPAVRPSAHAADDPAAGQDPVVVLAGAPAPTAPVGSTAALAWQAPGSPSRGRRRPGGRRSAAPSTGRRPAASTGPLGRPGRADPRRSTIEVMLAVRARFAAPGADRRSGASSAAGRSRLDPVVRRDLRPVSATIPSPRISWATVSTPKGMPRATDSARILGPSYRASLSGPAALRPSPPAVVAAGGGARRA